MEVKAKLNHLRIAPRKVRLVTELIKKKKVEKAQAILNFTVKRASKPLLKLLNSAIANAKNNLQLDPDNLYIFKITVDEGRKYKRWMPRARGRAAPIQKKTSRITLILDEIEPGKKIKKPRAEKAEKVKEKEVKPVKPKVLSVEPKEEEEKKETPEFKKARPKPETERAKPKPGFMKGIKRMFRRKSF